VLLMDNCFPDQYGCFRESWLSSMLSWSIEFANGK
jgi:hypothetical protein